MTRHFFRLLMLALAGLPAAQLPLRADTTNAAPARAEVLEGDVIYLRISQAGTNLADEIGNADTALPVSNKVIGIVLDLRFATGDDPVAVKPVSDWLASKKLPLAILVNSQTGGAAVALAATLREGRAGLIFGGTPPDLKPDITVTVAAADEKNFLENPYGLPVTNSAVALSATNDLLPFIDHTSEAELVSKKIKDGEDDGDNATTTLSPAPPVIRDPALARALDFLKALAILRPARG
jgi:hypothetical protein